MRDIFSARRENLIRVIKMKGFLNDPRVEEALRSVPRHFFVPAEFSEEAYEDEALPTKHGQTISQPSVVVLMTEWLDVREGQKVLEIGCGSGWQSAILAHLVGKRGQIYSIERLPDVIEFALENQRKAGVKNVELVEGDGTLGLPAKAAFDRIIVTAGSPKIPKPLTDQLATDGLLIAPIGERVQSMVLLQKTKTGLKTIRKEEGYIFVPLIGKHGFKG